MNSQQERVLLEDRFAPYRGYFDFDVDETAGWQNIPRRSAKDFVAPSIGSMIAAELMRRRQLLTLCDT